MSYVNRMYFRKDTGELLYRFMRVGGSAPVATIEQDMSTVRPLVDFMPEAVHVVEPLETDLDTIDKINSATEIRMDPETLEVIYTFPDPAAVLQAQIDALNAQLAALQGS